MKRVILLVLFFAVCGSLAALKLYSNGLLIISPEGGVYSTFSGGVQTYYDKTPFLSPASAQSERWDFKGPVYGELDALNAEILSVEYYADITVIYAYTPRLPKHVQLKCGKTNIMAAFGNVSCIGYPVLEGSY